MNKYSHRYWETFGLNIVFFPKVAPLIYKLCMIPPIMDSGKALFDSSTKPWKIAVSFLVLLIVLKVTRAVYNLYFHPLSRFPGPRQAALSDSWIHELSRSGKAEEEIEQLHKTYGVF